MLRIVRNESELVCVCKAEAASTVGQGHSCRRLGAGQHDAHGMSAERRPYAASPLLCRGTPFFAADHHRASKALVAADGGEGAPSLRKCNRDAPVVVNIGSMLATLQAA